MKRKELLIKSREAMLSAVQIYNNPQVMFKSETYITLAIIAWTYFFHFYFSNNNIDYRYYKQKGKRKIYDKTKYGAYKYWELERCLNEDNSLIDVITKENLRFLIGIRHEIEHQMTNKIDSTISAKILACSLNYNYYIKKIFGVEYGLDKDLTLAIQFSPITPEQKQELLNNEKVKDNVQAFISEYEDALSEQSIGNSRYAYRLLFTPLTANRRGQADKVIEFIKEGTEDSKKINNILIKEREIEKKKYFSLEIVNMMKDKGYMEFSINKMTDFWKKELGTRDGYGLYIGNTWMWYENWIPVIEKHCKNKYKK